MQKLAWERHGFRAANFAGTDSISRFGVAGTLDQIPAVSELPNNDAMQHLITTLQSAQAKLVADISMYDTMYTQNAQQYRELKMTVLAGKKALADFNANQLPALEAEAAASGDAMQAQVLKNFKSKLDRFAKRLDDLDRISVVTLQTAPQIKIIQNADQTIVDKIDTTISTTIPVWKSQMVIALGLSNQRKALDLQNKADEVTNKLLARNAAALHKGAVDAEKANQRSVVEIDTLEKINAELIATLKETVQIQKEGEANREAAQVKMRQIESDLKNALLENAQQMCAVRAPACSRWRSLRERATMLPLAEVYEYAYWCAYICSRWRELAAVRLAEGGHGARLGRLYRQPFPPQFLCGHNPGMIAALGNWMK